MKLAKLLLEEEFKMFQTLFYFEFDDVASILSNKKKFMHFLVTDYDKGTWFATRTTQK